MPEARTPIALALLVSFGCRDVSPAGGADPQGQNAEAAPALAALAPALPDEVSPKEPAPDEGLPVVTLDGVTHPHPVTRIARGVDRLYSRSGRTWIHAEPRRSSARLGYLRAGGSAPLAGPAVTSSDCSGGFHPIQPRGFVCLDQHATLDPKDPVVLATVEHPPDFSRKLPYVYGTVRNPGPIYARLPSKLELDAEEPGLDDRMQRWLDAPGEIGASFAQDVWLGASEGTLPDPRTAWQQRLSADVPELLGTRHALAALGGTRRAPDALRLGNMLPKAGYAFLETFLWEGRRYGVSSSLEVMPTDRLRPIRGSDFRGVEIGKDVKFPFAFVRRPNARYADGERADYRAVLPLTGKQRFIDGILHYETDAGRWISDRLASRLDPAKRMPGWGKNGEKWIDVNLTKQTLMLYEGTEPVYATLMSSGEAGLEDPATTTATKRGVFRVHTKHVTATMSSREIGEEFELNEVPYVMYFDKEGYALHGAYWHDSFGTPKSHGCINLSPEDARRVFHWAEPRVPTGWHGVLSALRGTVVFVHP